MVVFDVCKLAKEIICYTESHCVQFLGDQCRKWLAEKERAIKRKWRVWSVERRWGEFQDLVIIIIVIVSSGCGCGKSAIGIVANDSCLTLCWASLLATFDSGKLRNGLSIGGI